MRALLDDAVLAGYVEAGRHGDDLALARLVRATQSVVQRFCVNYSSLDEAEDLTQEVYIRAIRNLDQYRGDAPVVSWLLSIARHVCADQVRRNQRRARLASRLQAERPRPPAEPGALHLTDLIDSLAPDRRLAFVMTQVIGLSYEEAAAACECPVGTIRSRVARARADLMAAVRAAAAQ
jgi:RNA polymerase sigma-70 factor (ECF subfamily)